MSLRWGLDHLAIGSRLKDAEHSIIPGSFTNPPTKGPSAECRTLFQAEAAREALLFWLCVANGGERCKIFPP